MSRPEFGIDIEYDGNPGQKIMIQPDIKSKASKELGQILRQEIPINTIWKKPHDKKYMINQFVP